MAEILNEAQVPQQHQTHNATIIDIVNFRRHNQIFQDVFNGYFDNYLKVLSLAKYQPIRELSDSLSSKTWSLKQYNSLVFVDL